MFVVPQGNHTNDDILQRIQDADRLELILEELTASLLFTNSRIGSTDEKSNTREVR
jgi:hypothetical protein